jgi:hypothetical protein
MRSGRGKEILGLGQAKEGASYRYLLWRVGKGFVCLKVQATAACKRIGINSRALAGASSSSSRLAGLVDTQARRKLSMAAYPQVVPLRVIDGTIRALPAPASSQ